jgi:hypothetical protein
VPINERVEAEAHLSGTGQIPEEMVLRFVISRGSYQANKLKLCKKHPKVKPISVLAVTFWGQNRPSKKKWSMV